jgi:hypothetical protein
VAKFYYNDVLLPEIPADVLAEYPYCWIRALPTNTSYPYALYMSEKPSYKSGNYMNLLATYKQYYLDTSDVENATSWVLDSTATQDWSTCTINSKSSLVLWSNHDIPNGSATATDIYFYASYPKDENGNEVGKEEEPETPLDEYYKIKGSILTDIANETRRLVGTEASMTPYGMVQALAGVESGSGGEELQDAEGVGF